MVRNASNPPEHHRGFVSDTVEAERRANPKS
jgi:hypothetical protein